MISLTDCNRSDSSNYSLFLGKDYVVGRNSECAIPIAPTDRTVSRQHALLRVVLSLEDKKTKLEVKDLGSKTGIDCAGHKIAAHSSYVSSADCIRFGVGPSAFQVRYFPIVATTSTLSEQETTKINNVLQKLHGKLVKQWSNDCTHLIMPQITLTIKAVCALAAAKPIVNPQYFQACLKAASTKCQSPNPENYLPPLMEPTVNSSKVSVLPDLKRTEIFKGKCFVFGTVKHFKKMAEPVMLAGAITHILEEKSLHEEELLKPHILLVQMGSSRASQGSQVPAAYTNAEAILRVHGKRPINDAEIGLAILHISVEKHCNPDFVIRQSQTVLGVKKEHTFQAQESVSIIAPDSQTGQISARSVSLQDASCTSVVPDSMICSSSSGSPPNQSKCTFVNPHGQKRKRNDVQTPELLYGSADATSDTQQNKKHRVTYNDSFFNKPTKQEEVDDMFALPMSKQVPVNDDEFALPTRKKISVNAAECTSIPIQKNVSMTAECDEFALPALKQVPMNNDTDDFALHIRKKDQADADLEEFDLFAGSTPSFETQESQHMMEDIETRKSKLKETSTHSFSRNSKRPRQEMFSEAKRMTGAHQIKEHTVDSPETKRSRLGSSESHILYPDSKISTICQSPEPRVPTKKPSSHCTELEENVTKTLEKITSSRLQDTTISKNESRKAISLQGFLSKTHLTVHVSTDEPEVDVSVQVTSLVHKLQSPSINISNSSDSHKGFKRFRKVCPFRTSVVPRIIGGSDFVVHDSNGKKIDGHEFHSNIQNPMQGSPPRKQRINEWVLPSAKKKNMRF